MIAKITGGNGQDAKASVSMRFIDHSSPFNAQSQIGVGTELSTIGFSTYHKFRNSEQVIYRTNDQQSVGGISTNSSYFVSTKNQHILL